jgi:ABC-type lipoprotein export system ATPase subunit
MANIFEIGELFCSYSLSNSGKKGRVPVLHVKDIQIPQDKLTFILGSSGSGKSTFMEAIALMSDTVHNEGKHNSREIFFITPEGKKFNIINRHFEDDVHKKEVNLDNFRFENFSFIFQATNLMGNFTAKENVAITDYLHIEDGLQMTAEMAEEKAERRLVDMLQMTDIRSFDKKPNEYSGGQRQRFAFARALGAQANVLFGDEPTGNLDPHNSFVLLRLLRKLIKGNIAKSKEENGNIKSGIRNAILVSHSLELALSFADIIIVIVPPNPKSENLITDDIKADNKKSNEDLSCGRTNKLLVYDNDKIQWRTGDMLDEDDSIFKKTQREISFLLNYEFIPLSNLLVDLYGIIIADDKIDEYELKYFNEIKDCFTKNFYYRVIFENKPVINKKILLSKVDEINNRINTEILKTKMVENEKEEKLRTIRELSSFVNENINLNWN